MFWIIVAAGGRITRNQMRELVHLGYVGNARTALVSNGMIEPWHDALVLTERGREYAGSTTLDLASHEQIAPGATVDTDLEPPHREAPVSDQRQSHG